MGTSSKRKGAARLAANQREDSDSAGMPFKQISRHSVLVDPEYPGLGCTWHTAIAVSSPNHPEGSPCLLYELEGILVFDEFMLAKASIQVDVHVTWVDSDPRDVVIEALDITREVDENVEGGVVYTDPLNAISFATPLKLVDWLRTKRVINDSHSPIDVESFKKGLALWMDSVLAVAMSTFLTSGIIVTDGSFKSFAMVLPQEEGKSLT